MALLLDTHAFLWWLAGDLQRSSAAATVIEKQTGAVFVSAACVWEIATKYRIGKLPGIAAIATDLDGAISRHGFQGLAVSTRHGQMAGSMPGSHRDPFDRMLIAPAILENVSLVSNEVLFDSFGARRIW